MLRALHQVSLDGGGWQTAKLLLPRGDPLEKESFGASEKELEATVAYQEALRRITPNLHHNEDQADKDPKEKDAKGAGKGK